MFIPFGVFACLMSVGALPDFRFCQNTKMELLCKSVLKLWESVISSYSREFAYMACVCLFFFFFLNFRFLLVSTVYLSKEGSNRVFVIKIKLCAHSKQNLFSLHFEAVQFQGLLNNRIYPKVLHLHWKGSDSHLYNPS